MAKILTRLNVQSLCGTKSIIQSGHHLFQSYLLWTLIEHIVGDQGGGSLFAFQDTLFNEFVIAHTLGWWGKAIMVRDLPILWVLSIGFETDEVSSQWIGSFFNCKCSLVMTTVMLWWCLNQVIMFSCHSLLYEFYLWKFQLGLEDNYGLNLWS